jgi:hypothetical protein
MLCIEMGWYTTHTDERHVYSLMPINRLDMFVYPTSVFQILGGLMPYLGYLCLFPHSGVQRILYYVCVLFFFILCTVCCQFLGILRFDCPFDIL